MHVMLFIICRDVLSINNVYGYLFEAQQTIRYERITSCHPVQNTVVEAVRGCFDNVSVGHLRTGI